MQKLNKSLPNFSQAFSQLIALPSISSSQANWDQSNQSVINLLAAWFETLGFDITIQVVPNTTGKYNLLAKLGSGDGGLLLAGHSDTVPFDENPYSAFAAYLKTDEGVEVFKSIEKKLK